MNSKKPLISMMIKSRYFLKLFLNICVFLSIVSALFLLSCNKKIYYITNILSRYLVLINKIIDFVNFILDVTQTSVNIHS